MAPELKSVDPGSCPPFLRSRSVLVALVAILAFVSVGHGLESLRAQDTAEDSITLTTFECSSELSLDGSPMAESDCSGESDRTFTLSGPDDQRIELQTSFDPTSDGVEYRQAAWSADLDDEMPRSGTWSLSETSPDQESEDLVTCLKVIGARFTPAALDFGEDRSVEFDWNAAVRLAPDTVAGEYLECGWYSVPQLTTDERPGLLRIRNAVGRDPSDADLVIVEPDGEPQNFGNTEAGDIPPVTFEMTNDESGDEFELQSDDSSGELTSTFALVAGDYTITAPSTGRSSSFRLDEGQTVLVLNTLEERAAVTGDPTPIVVDLRPTEADEPTVRPEPTAPPPTVDDSPSNDIVQVFEFSASDWTGAYPDVVTAVYGRDCVALYGRNSRYPSARLTFTAEDADNGQSELVLTGLDDEWAGQVPIVVTVNGEVVYHGGSGFNSWDPGSSAVAWSRVAVTFDSELIEAGENEIVVTNLAEAANFGIPPYILLAEASVHVNSPGDS